MSECKKCGDKYPVLDYRCGSCLGCSGCCECVSPTQMMGLGAESFNAENDETIYLIKQMDEDKEKGYLVGNERYIREALDEPYYYTMDALYDDEEKHEKMLEAYETMSIEKICETLGVALVFSRKGGFYFTSIQGDANIYVPDYVENRAESLMAINQNTPISNFTTNELTHSSTVQGDFNQASINSSGHQNFEVRGAETFAARGTYNLYKSQEKVLKAYRDSGGKENDYDSLPPKIASTSKNPYGGFHSTWDAESFGAEAIPIRHSRRLNGYYAIKGYEDASEDGFIYRIYRAPDTNDWFKATVYDNNAMKDNFRKPTSRRLNPSGEMVISNDPPSLLIGAFPKLEDAKRALVFRMIQDGNYHQKITDGNLKWLLKDYYAESFGAETFNERCEDPHDTGCRNRDYATRLFGPCHDCLEEMNVGQYDKRFERDGKDVWAAEDLAYCPRCGLNPNDNQPLEQQRDESDHVKEHGVCNYCMEELIDEGGEEVALQFDEGRFSFNAESFGADWEDFELPDMIMPSKIHWIDVRAFKDDDNDGYHYGILFQDEEGQVIRIPMYKTEEERDAELKKAQELHRKEYGAESFEAEGGDIFVKTFIEEMARRMDGTRKSRTWISGYFSSYDAALKDAKKEKATYESDGDVGYVDLFVKDKGKIIVDANNHQRMLYTKIIYQRYKHLGDNPDVLYRAESFGAEYGKRQRFGNRYIARDTKGKFISNVSVGRSLKADRRSKSKTPARSGFGHKGDSQKGASSDFKLPTDAKSLIGIGAVLGGLLAYLESKA